MVDARDPLLYRSEDLEAYARSIHPTKHSLVLLNKADLLPVAVRKAWADFFNAKGVKYTFFAAAKVGRRFLTASVPEIS